MNDHEKLFLLTDGCMWEANKKAGTSHPHTIEVVDLKTGAVRYIKSGSVISFHEGFITETRDQESYNAIKAEAPPEEVHSDRKDKHDRKRSKKES